MDPVTLLQRMLEIESLSRHERPLAEFLVEQMTALGFENAHIDEAGNAVGERSSPDNAGAITHELILLGHMDTVPGRIPVRIEGDLLYGRGSVDAKGPLATFICAAAKAQLPTGTRIAVIGAVEEEVATSKGARHIAATRRAPAAVVIGEPSGWDAVTLGYKGRLLARYRLEQAMSHTAGPDVSVAEQAVEWWNTLRAHAERFNEGREALFERLLPSLRHINTDSDGITDTVEALAGFRLPPDVDPAALEAVARENAGNATVECTGHERAWQSPRTTGLARAFVASIRAAGVSGVRPAFKLKTGTSDMNVVGPVWQCPIVAYGPGDSRLDHTPNEHVSVSEYLRAIDVLARVIESGEWRAG